MGDEARMRFYANENFPRQTVEALRGLGHDVLTSAEAERANKRVPDGEVLEFAVAEERTLLTINRKDFIRLHNLRPDTEPPHFGIVACKQDADFAGQGQRIHTAVAEESPMNGKLIRVNRPG